MRIVSGKFKGRAVIAPKGSSTRPTTDRTRESLFNVLAHAPWSPGLDDARIIDLFAGSGALGLEAMSRGGAFCLFVDTDAAARGAIRQNIDAFQLFGQTRLHRRSATDLGPKPAGVGEPFGLAFLDPPYGKDLVPKTLQNLIEGDWLRPGAIAIVETGPDEALDLPDWTTEDDRTYGSSRIRFLSRK
ncbi:MAG: 16S rRNA (guanine(966)-N(2))-methyltransferase RsmD [Pseudomonadota bacterium]